MLSSVSSRDIDYTVHVHRDIKLSDWKTDQFCDMDGYNRKSLNVTITDLITGSLKLKKPYKFCLKCEDFAFQEVDYLKANQDKITAFFRLSDNEYDDYTYPSDSELSDFMAGINKELFEAITKTFS